MAPREKLWPETVRLDAEAALTFPNTVTAFAGGATPGGRDPLVSVELPVLWAAKYEGWLAAPPPKRKPPAPPGPDVHVPVVPSSMTVVADIAPLAALVPLTVTQSPTARAPLPTTTVALMCVPVLTVTVVWPDSGLRTSRVSPEISTRLPEAAGPPSKPV